MSARYSNLDVSPAPWRTISGSSVEKSITVVGSVPQSPESMMASMTWSRRSLISQPWVSGSQFGQQGVGHLVVRDAHADRLLSRVQQAAGNFLGGRQDERVAAGGGRLDRAEDPVVHVDQLAQLGEVLADQGEVVAVVQLPDGPDPVDAVLVPELATQRET